MIRNRDIKEVQEREEVAENNFLSLKGKEIQDAVCPSIYKVLPIPLFIR